MAQDNVSPFARKLALAMDEIEDLLLEKNASYGDSALDPIRIMSKCDAQEQLRVRIDDKLSRLARGTGSQEDTILDLIGYLIMLRMAQRRETQ